MCLIVLVRPSKKHAANVHVVQVTAVCFFFLKGAESCCKVGSLWLELAEHALVVHKQLLDNDLHRAFNTLLQEHRHAFS